MKYRAYIDIETTGLSRAYAELTVVGVGLSRGGECRVRQLVGGEISAGRLVRILGGVEEMYSYNGSRFDLPFIKARLGVDLKRCFKHRDLMYDCWRQDLKGGLKAVERKLGIRRGLQDVDGYAAVLLWWDYVNNGNRRALRRLLEYNREDVVNLEVLRRKLGVD